VAVVFVGASLSEWFGSIRNMRCLLFVIGRYARAPAGIDLAVRQQVASLRVVQIDQSIPR
jgi:hypothetical protein